MRRLLFVLALAAALPAQGTFFSGEDLYERLLDFSRARPENPAAASQAAGFVMGVADTLEEIRHEGTGFRFCLPPGTTLPGLVEVTVRYLRDHPQNRHLAAHSLVQAAFAAAFPCAPAGSPARGGTG